MVAGPITSWQKHGKTVKDIIFLGSKITAEIDWSHEIKRCLLLGRIAMTNLDSVLKSRDITLLTKVCIVKAIVFPVVMYGCESWTIKRVSTEELMCLKCGAGGHSWEPLGLQDQNQSILQETNHEYSLEGLMLKFQYFGHLMWRVNSLGKIPMLGKIPILGKVEGRRRGQ